MKVLASHAQIKDLKFNYDDSSFELNIDDPAVSLAIKRVSQQLLKKLK